MSSFSQEPLLPMPVQASDPRHSAGIHVPIPVVFYDATSGQYDILPASDGASDTDSEDGTVAGDESDSKDPSAKSTPNPGAHAPRLVPMHVVSPADATSSSAFSWYRAISGTLWYTRMCLLLVLLCTAATLATGAVFAFIGNVAFLGSIAPYSTMLDKEGYNETKACAAGAGVLGCAVGLLAFGCFVVRRARMSEAERNPAPPPAPVLANGRYAYEYRTSPLSDEPEELWPALAVAALAGVFALAVGVAVVPGLTADAGGFGVKHALAVGAWGLGAPLTPMVVCMFVATLWRCDPCAGAECCCEGLGACCNKD